MSTHDNINSIDRAYLQSGKYVDSDHHKVQSYARGLVANMESPVEKAVKLYYVIRDGFKYDPFMLDFSDQGLRASDLLNRDHGYCIEKANLLAASARVVGIPARLGFGIVKNHLGIDRYSKIIKSDLLVFHGYAELWLNDKWVKATPAFNAQLCHKIGVKPLEFDGLKDSMFQESDQKGDKFMEYIHDYGTFQDIPKSLFIAELKRYYPHLTAYFDAEKINLADYESTIE